MHDGLAEFHELLIHDGLPEFHALLEPAIDQAHREARILYGFPVFIESLTLKPKKLLDKDLVCALLSYEEEMGLMWAA